MSTASFSHKSFNQQLKKYYGVYTGGFIAFVIALAIAEQIGMSRQWIGYWFLFATIALYAIIGIMSRTVDAAEYYVAGRRVPAFFNGMATGADWMSAASFIGMAGTLYLSGYDGLSFVMGWTGGYVLVALFLAPYLRKFGQFTIPDFLGARYGGNIVRSIGIFAAILCSFTYVVAQIYGVGLITSRFTGLEFGIGVFVGLAGILVCSFLGGMRAVTWTQVAQYIILIIAYLTPVVWLGMKHTGIPVPQFAYGSTLQKIGDLEKKITADPKEQEARKLAAQAAAQATAATKDLPKATAERRALLEEQLAKAKASGNPGLVKAAERELANWPTDPNKAKEIFDARKGYAANANPPRPHATPLPGQGREGAAHRAAQLPRHRVLHDVRHRGAAAHPDAVLHHAERAAGARFGVLVAVLHLPAVLHRADPCGAREVRRVLQPRGEQLRRPARVGGGLAIGGSDAAHHQRSEFRRHRAARRDRDRRRHHRARHARDRRIALRGVGPGGGGRPCGGAFHGRRAAAHHR